MYMKTAKFCLVFLQCFAIWRSFSSIRSKNSSSWTKSIFIRFFQADVKTNVSPSLIQPLLTHLKTYYVSWHFFPLFNILNTVFQTFLKGDIINPSSHFSCFPLNPLIFPHHLINIVPQTQFSLDLPSTESRIITFQHPESSPTIISKQSVPFSTSRRTIASAFWNCLILFQHRSPQKVSVNFDVLLPPP